MGKRIAKKKRRVTKKHISVGSPISIAGLATNTPQPGVHAVVVMAPNEALVTVKDGGNEMHYACSDVLVVNFNDKHAGVAKLRQLSDMLAWSFSQHGPGTIIVLRRKA